MSTTRQALVSRLTGALEGIYQGCCTRSAVRRYVQETGTYTAGMTIAELAECYDAYPVYYEQAWILSRVSTEVRDLLLSIWECEPVPPGVLVSNAIDTFDVYIDFGPVRRPWQIGYVGTVWGMFEKIRAESGTPGNVLHHADSEMTFITLVQDGDEIQREPLNDYLAFGDKRKKSSLEAEEREFAYS